MKKLLCLVLAVLALAAPLSALAEGTVVVKPGTQLEIDPEGRVTEVSAPAQTGEEIFDPGFFLDVDPGAWYAFYVNLAAGKELLKGTGGGYFHPEGTVTLAEVVTLAARVYAQAVGQTIPAAAAKEPWYAPAYRFCVTRLLFTEEEVPMDKSLTQPATRFQVVDFLDRATPTKVDAQLNVIHNGDIPDLRENQDYGEVVYRWFRMGILEGDQRGYFHGSRTIDRASMAAILCRLTGSAPRIIQGVN